MRYPLKNVFITQEWGKNPDTYARFGLKGHNVLDLRASIGTDVFAPHDGVVKERRFDAEGYGNYLKIESDKEGSILAHLQDFKVGLNQNVKEGDLVGYADNTGFSTASHLHWGYYPIPRNRKDGYLGYINQLPLLKEGGDMANGCLLKNDAEGQKIYGNLVGKADKYDGFVKIGFDNAGAVVQRIEEINEALKTERTAKSEAEEATEERRKHLNDLLTFLASDLALQTRIDETEIRNKAIQFGNLEGERDGLKDDFSRKITDWNKMESDLRAEIARLKALSEQGTLSQAKTDELIREIIRRLTKIVTRR